MVDLFIIIKAKINVLTMIKIVVINPLPYTKLISFPSSNLSFAHSIAYHDCSCVAA